MSKKMSLPSSFNDKNEYVLEALDFLKRYQWLYNFQNTHILVHHIFEKMSADWVTYFRSCSKRELKEIAVGNYSVKDRNIPNSLEVFLEDLQKLKPNNLERFNKDVSDVQQVISHNSGLSKKKMHEILHLAPFVDQICKDTGCNTIIDIGSGLGYLSHLLHDHYNYRVLGIECCQNYIEQAYKLQEKNYPQSKNYVKFVNHFIDENSYSTIEHLLEDNFGNIESKKVCITGLHACADLSVTILDLFSKIESVSSLVVMPCCYHRMKLDYQSDNSETFKYFPASSLCKNIFEKYEASYFLRRPFLRLACQHTVESFVRMTSEDLERQARNCMYRAILQDVAVKENHHIRRRKRKSGKSQSRPLDSTDADFENYLHNLVETHQLLPTTSSSDVTMSMPKQSAKNEQFKEVSVSSTDVSGRRIVQNQDVESTEILQERENFSATVSSISKEKREIDSNLATMLSTGNGVRENAGNMATTPCTLKINDSAFLKKMREKWEKHKGNGCLFEALTALQFSIQSLCENVVLLDRVEFLSEKGLECYVKMVAEGFVSPRCHALVAVKR